MNKRFLIIGFILVIFASCQQAKPNKDLILGTWHAIKVENKFADSFLRKGQYYIDTMGKGHDDATNIELFGTANMDSMRRVLQMEMDSMKIMQEGQQKQTIFKFEKNGKVSLGVPGRFESGDWHINKNGQLVLVEENKVDGGNSSTDVDIITLNDTSLKLMFVAIDSGIKDTSYVSFRKEGK